MEIYKFNGASVKNTSGMKNVFDIVKEAEGKLVVVISAMGKTTDMLREPDFSPDPFYFALSCPVTAAWALAMASGSPR